MLKQLIRTFLNLNFLILISLLVFSCSFEKNDPDLICCNDWDFRNIPDKYNTGANENTVFHKLTSDSYVADNVFVQLRTDTNPYTYNLSGNRNDVNKFPDNSVVRDYDFSDYQFVIQNSHRFPRCKHITFENCKFKSFRNDAAQKGNTKIYVEFINCSFCGGVNSSYMTFRRCKIGGFTSDGMNPLREVYADGLYIYDLMHEGNQNGTHVDGMQIYGDQASRNNVFDNYWISTVETGDIHFNNVRFEIPSIHFEGSTTYINASVMFSLEFSDVDFASFENLYVNGAGFYHSFFLGEEKNKERSVNGAWSHKGLRMQNAMVSNNYAGFFYSNRHYADKVENVVHHDNLFVTSVWKDQSGTAHVIVTNDTKNEHQLIIKTDIGTFTHLIPHCPSDFALHGNVVNGKPQTNKAIPNEALVDSNGRAYTTYRWDDMPIDVDYTVSGNPSFVLCYQENEQIRYVSLDGKNHYYSEIK